MSNYSVEEFFNDISFDDYARFKLVPGLVCLPYEIRIVGTQIVQTEPRAISARWTREIAQDLSVYGIDIEAELTRVLQQELRNSMNEEL